MCGLDVGRRAAERLNMEKEVAARGTRFRREEAAGSVWGARVVHVTYVPVLCTHGELWPILPVR